MTRSGRAGSSPASRIIRPVNVIGFAIYPQAIGRNNARMDTMTIETEYLTVAQAAKLIGLSHAQVTRYIKRGDLAAERIGWQILVPLKAARAFQPRPRGNPRWRARSPDTP